MSDHTRQGDPNDPVSVTVPSWAVTDWGAAAVMALRTVLTFIAIGFLVLASIVLLFLIRFGASGLDLGSLLGTAFSLPLVYLGAYQDTPVLLTGILVLVFALGRSARAVPLPSFEGNRVRMFALAGKVAVVSILLLLVDAIVMDTLDLIPAGGLGSGLGLIQAFTIDYVRLVFLTGPVIGVFALFQIARASHSSIVGGPLVKVPGVVTTSWVGAKRTLRISLIGLLVLFAVGSILESLTADFGEFSLLADAILSVLLLVVVFVAVDVATLFFVGAMSFLQFEALFTQGAWEWAGVALVAVAFFLGGRAAANRAGPKTVAEAVTAASLIGVLLSGIGILVAIDYQGLAGQEEFAAPAILLPLLWTVPALAGAWWYASERQLPSGVAVSVTTSDSGVPKQPDSYTSANAPRNGGTPARAPEDGDPGTDRPAIAEQPQHEFHQVEQPVAEESVQENPESTDIVACPSCGASNPGDHAFCSACGKPIS